VLDRIPHRLEDGVGQVVEYHAQRGDPAQCVQPGEPRSGCGPGGADLWLMLAAAEMLVAVAALVGRQRQARPPRLLGQSVRQLGKQKGR
jgi:hypothetical protein